MCVCKVLIYMLFEVNCTDLAIASYQSIRGCFPTKLKSNCFTAAIKCDL